MQMKSAHNFAEQISENFSVAKLLAILLVVTGHYFDGSLLWVPVSIGLFVFSFSSGYFSAARYQGVLDIRKFWSGKFRRLLPALFVVNIFLLLIFVMQGRSGIWHHHTIIAWFGLSGILDWFGIRNASPFGNGLWFFTALLIFYVVYPVFNSLCSSRSRSVIFIFCFAIICFLGQVYASLPYMLWLTIFGFGFGVFASRVDWHPSRAFAWSGLGVVVLVFLIVNIFGYKQLNIIFIALMSIYAVAILLCAPLHERYIGPLALWIPCVLEIYLLHTYIFVRSPALGDAMGYLLSMLLVLSCAYAMFRMRKLVEKGTVRARLFS
jgi:peptidoglycan/LPS O-acetylase OafA/YrhL